MVVGKRFLINFFPHTNHGFSKKTRQWRMMGVYDTIEESEGAAAATVSDGYCSAIRLNGESFESVDNEGSVCSYLHTNKGKFSIRKGRR